MACKILLFADEDNELISDKEIFPDDDFVEDETNGENRNTLDVDCVR